MKTFYGGAGPFLEKPFFTKEDIENICVDELVKVDLYPKEPSPIRIDRFIEKKFGKPHEYGDLPTGVLGYTLFGPKGVEKIIVARSLDQENSKVSQRRINSTLAHEVGHGLLHSHLFVLADQQQTAQLFERSGDVSTTKVLCRNEAKASSGSPRRKYDGRWWEYQANQVMSTILLPKTLVIKSLVNYLAKSEQFGIKTLDSAKKTEAVKHLSEAFDVNPILATIRLQDLFPPEKESQLTI